MEGTGSNKFIILTDNNGGVMRMHSNRRMQASILSAMEHEDDNMYDVSLYGVPPSSTPDTTLKPIRAHKLILAFASKHLRDLLTSDNYTDSHQSEYHIENVDHESLSRIVQFIYNDQMMTTAENAVDVLCRVLIGAKYLVMENLADACEAYLAGEESVKTENCVKLWCFARKYSCLALMHATSTFIVDHLTDMPKDDEFLRMPYDDCAKLLLSEAFVVANDDLRCLAAMAWLSYSSADRSSFVGDIVNMIPLTSGALTAETALEINECEILWKNAPDAVRAVMRTMLTTVKAAQPPVRTTVSGGSGQSNIKCWYVIGGTAAPNLFMQYDVDRRTWSKFPDLPWSREYCGACSVDGEQLVVMGGVKNQQSSTHIDYYQLSSKKWTTVGAQLSSARNSLTVCSVKSNVFALGGSNQDVVESYEYGYTYRPRERNASMFAKRNSCVAAAATDSDGKSCIYVAGGACECKIIEKFDISNNMWSEVGKVGESRSSLAGTISGDDLYIMGGFCYLHSSPCTTVEIFNINTGKTRTAQPLLEARGNCFATTVCDGNVVCIGGGYDSRTHACLNTVETYDKREGKWTTGGIVPNMPIRTHHFGFAAV